MGPYRRLLEQRVQRIFLGRGAAGYDERRSRQREIPAVEEEAAMMQVLMTHISHHTLHADQSKTLT